MKKKETNQFDFIELKPGSVNKCIQITLDQLIQQYGFIRRDMRSLWTSQSFIQAYRNCIIAKFSYIPAIITQNKMLILYLDPTTVNPFVQQFDTISQEIQQYQTEWELICLESILSFIYNRLNQQYLQVAAKFESENIVGANRHKQSKLKGKIRFLKKRHQKMEKISPDTAADLNIADTDVIQSLAYSQESLQELSIACTQLDKTLEGLLEDDDLMVRLCFKNQTYLEDNQPQKKKGLQKRKKTGDAPLVSSSVDLKQRVQTLTRQKSVTDGIGSSAGGSGAFKTASSQNLTALTQNAAFLGVQQERSAIPQQSSKGSSLQLRTKTKQGGSHEDQYLSVPYALEALVNQFELYKFQTKNLSVELRELEQKAALNVIERNLKLEVERSFLLSFSLVQRFVNVSMLIGSVLGQLFGMNLLNPWRLSDGPEYSSSSITPFIIVSIITLVSFSVSLAIFTLKTAEIRNFDTKSLKRKQSIRKQNESVESKLKKQRNSYSQLIDSAQLTGDYSRSIQGGKINSKKGFKPLEVKKRKIQIASSFVQ